tara:strand:+ start:955 stop:1629 length:675 start_codon:yes stop_codon:yes gene_type:complete
MTDDLGYRPFDCDNHYYEGVDAFTRHVPAEMQPRVVQWCEMDGRRYHVVGGRVSHAVVNPTWDPIAKPGALYQYFRGNPDGKSPLELLRDREPLPAEYIDREARLRTVEAQGLEAVWLFPTLGVLYEELLKEDTEAVGALMVGFNRWLQEDWGFAHGNTIFAAPYLSLADPTSPSGNSNGAWTTAPGPSSCGRPPCRPPPGHARPPTGRSTRSGPWPTMRASRS